MKNSILLSSALIFALFSSTFMNARLEKCVTCKFNIEEDSGKKDYQMVFNLSNTSGIESTQAAQDKFCQNALKKGQKIMLAPEFGKTGLKNFLSFGLAGNTYNVVKGIEEAEKKGIKPVEMTIAQDGRHPSKGSIECNVKSAAQFTLKGGKLFLEVGGRAIMTIGAMSLTMMGVNALTH